MIIPYKSSPISFLCFLNILFLVPGIFAEGFAAGTLVKTYNGYIPIEQIKIGDTVTTYNGCGLAVECKVIDIFKKKYDHYLEIIVEDEILHVACDQKFYVNDDEKPLRKAQFLRDHVLSAHYNWFDSLPIISISPKEGDIELYSISVADNHNFCVTPYNIYVHNILPFIAIGLSWTFGAGSIEFVGIALTTIVAGISLDYMLSSDEELGGYAHSFAVTLSSAVGTPTGVGGEDCMYDDAPYHHQNSNKWRKSAAPLDGAEALRYSVPANPKSQNSFRRIGVSKGQFVVLDRTSLTPKCIYHGHVRPWNELTDDMQKALKNAGLVNPRGKILI